MTNINNKPANQIVFQTRGLTKVYVMGEVSVHALRGIDMELFAGEFVALLGPSGSGKSTLLNILGGLDTATIGHVSYLGWDLTMATEKELTEFRRRHVGFVFQFYNLIPSLTALENVAVITEISKTPMRPEDALEKVNRELGTTTAIITHNAVIADMADRVIRLSDGHIANVRRNETKRRPAELHW